MMQKIRGADSENALRQIGVKCWSLYYGRGEDADGVFVYRSLFDHRPTMKEVKETVLGHVNSLTQERILSGFSWGDHPVWLSEANQMNYARDYALAREGSVLPTYKFGTDEVPVYYTFGSLEEFRQFTQAWSGHISAALRAGWSEKESVDWRVFGD